MSAVLEEAYEQRRSVAPRLIAKAAGHLLAASLVFGLDCKLRSRYLPPWVAWEVSSHGYNTRRPLTGRALAEFVLWRERATQPREQPVHEHRSRGRSTATRQHEQRRKSFDKHRSLAPTSWAASWERDFSSTLLEMLGYAHTAKSPVSCKRCSGAR